MTHAMLEPATGRLATFPSMVRTPTATEDARFRRADRDQDLVDALLRREATATERLVSRYGDRAYRLASRITGNAQASSETISPPRNVRFGAEPVSPV